MSESQWKENARKKVSGGLNMVKRDKNEVEVDGC